MQDEFEQVAVHPLPGDVVIMRGGQVRYTVRPLPDHVRRYGSDVVLAEREVTYRQLVAQTQANTPGPILEVGATVPVCVTTVEPCSMHPSVWTDLVRDASSVIMRNFDHPKER